MSEKNLALVFGPVLDFIFLNVKSFKAFRARCEWFLHGVVYDRIYPGVKQGPLTEHSLTYKSLLQCSGTGQAHLALQRRENEERKC